MVASTAMLATYYDNIEKKQQHKTAHWCCSVYNIWIYSFEIHFFCSSGRTVSLSIRIWRTGRFSIFQWNYAILRLLLFFCTNGFREMLNSVNLHFRLKMKFQSNSVSSYQKVSTCNCKCDSLDQHPYQIIHIWISATRKIDWFWNEMFPFNSHTPTQKNALWNDTSPIPFAIGIVRIQYTEANCWPFFHIRLRLIYRIDTFVFNWNERFDSINRTTWFIWNSSNLKFKTWSYAKSFHSKCQHTHTQCAWKFKI